MLSASLNRLGPVWPGQDATILRDGNILDYPELVDIKLACIKDEPATMGCSLRTIMREYTGASLMRSFNDLASSYRRNMALLVAELDGQTVGYCRAVHEQNSPVRPYLSEIDSLFVHPGYRGLGIGQQLLAAMRHQLQQARRPLPYVKVGSQARALGFYQQHGQTLLREKANSVHEWVVIGFGGLPAV